MEYPWGRGDSGGMGSFSTKCLKNLTNASGASKAGRLPEPNEGIQTSGSRGQILCGLYGLRSHAFQLPAKVFRFDSDL
jgi:hypothetical protein